MPVPGRPKGSEPIRMIRVDDDVRDYIASRTRWGESMNLTLRRLFKLGTNGIATKRKKGVRP